jgi:hypothetical protein
MSGPAPAYVNASGASGSKSMGQSAANAVGSFGKGAANAASSVGSSLASVLGFGSSSSASGSVSGATTGGARRTRRLRNMRGRFLSKAKTARMSRRSSRVVAGHKMATVGTKAQVYHGTAKHTSGGLTKADLMHTKKGRIVSRRKHAAGKKALQRLRKAGYKAKKGTFRLFRK